MTTIDHSTVTLEEVTRIVDLCMDGWRGVLAERPDYDAIRAAVNDGTAPRDDLDGAISDEIEAAVVGCLTSGDVRYWIEPRIIEPAECASCGASHRYGALPGECVDCSPLQTAIGGN